MGLGVLSGEEPVGIDRVLPGDTHEKECRGRGHPADVSADGLVIQIERPRELRDALAAENIAKPGREFALFVADACSFDALLVRHKRSSRLGVSAVWGKLGTCRAQRLRVRASR